jgi:hypothetical protein
MVNFGVVRRAVLLLLIVILALSAGAGAAGATPTATTTYAYGARSGSAAVAAKLAQAPAGFTGGVVTATDGEQVTVYVEDELAAVDPGMGQRWADMLTGLVHGPEISTISVYVATLARVQQTCGRDALGCYGSNRLITMADDLPGISARAVLTHEYGHHVADSRDNSPWQAVDYGPKRWATQVGVCSRAASGELAPGDESSRYTLNPGEAFAEDYRVLNERRDGLPETAWQVVDQSFYPDQATLDAVAADVTTPWTGPTTTTLRSSFTARATGRGFRLAAPLDGTFKVTLTSPKGGAFTLRLVDPAGGKVIGTAAGSQQVKSLETNVCGQRTLQVQVKRVHGAGAFTLTVSKP